MVFVLDPATGAKVGSIALPGLPLVGVAADPRDPNLVFVASENALYSADVQTLHAHNVYNLPSTAKATFGTLGHFAQWGQSVPGRGKLELRVSGERDFCR